MNRKIKLTPTNWWLIIIVTLLLLFLFSLVIDATAQDFKIASPFISIRDPRIGTVMDYLLGMTVFDYMNKQVLSFEFERLNGFPYREIIFRTEAYGWYIDWFEKTSRAIENADVGYFRQFKWVRMGGSVHRDISGDVALLADIGVQSRYITAKFQRGLKTWVLDAELKWSKPLRKELFSVWGFKFIPGYEVLLKYYVDGQERIFRQAKISFSIGAVK